MSADTLTLTFTELRKGLLRLALRFLPDEDDANDALQDAFVKLWPKRDEIKTRGEAEALTVTTIRNQCIDNIRKRRLEIVEIDEERDGMVSGSFDVKMEEEEQFKEVETIINSKLSNLQQSVLKMKEYEDKSIEEIAKLLNMEQAAVRMHLSRARKTIRECYQNQHRNENIR